jgi:hypothetical protein
LHALTPASPSIAGFAGDEIRCDRTNALTPWTIRGMWQSRHVADAGAWRE